MRRLTDYNQQSRRTVKRGFVLLAAKFLAGFLPTLLVSQLFGAAGVLGITPLMLLAAVTNSNGGMYLRLDDPVRR